MLLRVLDESMDDFCPLQVASVLRDVPPKPKRVTFMSATFIFMSFASAFNSGMMRQPSISSNDACASSCRKNGDAGKPEERGLSSISARESDEDVMIGRLNGSTFIV